MDKEDSMKSLKMLAIAALLLCLTVSAAWAAGTPESYLGNPMPDFTVTTITGDASTLSEALKTKKAVLVNLWATWCPPCEMEFPFMEKAYQRYKDQVEVIALSVESTDTKEKLTEYAESHGMTFPVASDSEAGLGKIFANSGIPTTILVDRFGNVALIEVGAQPSEAFFSKLFDLLISNEYTETQVLDGEDYIVGPIWALYFYDQNGDPVPGCIVNFCSDTACNPVVSNAKGLAVFQGPAYEYHLQVIKVPAGYEFDTTQEFTTNAEGGAYRVTVPKQ